MIGKPHKKLDLWKKVIELSSLIYQITKGFPAEEKYGLTAQMRRSCVSIASNIAEGAARQTNKEFARFLFIAKGSLSELDAQCDIAIELAFIKNSSLEHLGELMVDVDKMLTGLIRALKNK
jgi:four helix bundle protein